MFNTKGRILIVLVLGALVALGSYLSSPRLDSSGKSIVREVGAVSASSSPVAERQERSLEAVPAETTPSPRSTVTPAPLPASYALVVPFTSQAPSGSWDALHEDACEEASLLMVKRYKESVDAPATEAAEQELTSLVQSEGSMGYGLSITLEQLRVLGEKRYGTVLAGGAVTPVLSVDDIKKAVATGHPVIVGAAGKLLHNPNFKGGGPNYHMLVIIGYTPTEFITNDPGTRNGKGYHYTYQVLMDAIHDWTEGPITDGARSMLTFE